MKQLSVFARTVALVDRCVTFRSLLYAGLALCATLIVPSFVHAGDFELMVGIPFIDPDNINIESYINVLYWLSIMVAAVLAVLKITIAGVKYVMSDIVTSKESAKKDIQGAIFGLVIVLAAVIILNTINTDLTTFAILSTVTDDTVESSVQVTGRAPTDQDTVLEALAACSAEDGMRLSFVGGVPRCVPGTIEDLDATDWAATLAAITAFVNDTSNGLTAAERAAALQRLADIQAAIDADPNGDPEPEEPTDPTDPVAQATCPGDTYSASDAEEASQTCSPPTGCGTYNFSCQSATTNTVNCFCRAG